MSDDVVAVEIARGRFEGLAEEMLARLRRGLRSAQLTESGDFATGVVDSRGRLVVVSTGDPIHAIPMRQSVQAVLRERRFDLDDDDAILINDPYRGGTHLGDVTLTRVCFLDRNTLILPTCRAHLDDIGCAAPGLLFPQAYEIFQEGDRMPPLFLYKSGKLRPDVLRKIEKNSRTPDLVRATLDAMVNATALGAQRLKELSSELGTARLSSLVDGVFDHSERLVEGELATWPRGTYRGEAVCPTDFQGATGLRVHAAVHVEGGSLSVDFAGSSDQARGFVNSTLSNTAAAVLMSVLPFLRLPVNDGLLRRLAVSAPAGSVVNASFPAAVGWSARHVGSEIVEAVTRALAAALPERAGVTWADVPHCSVSRYDFADRSVYLDETALGCAGEGASDGHDGWGWPGLLSTHRLPSIEERERQRPVVVEQRELATDSGGAGAFRGAPGTIVVERYTGEQARLLVYVRGEPFSGLQGGHAGSGAAVWVERADEGLSVPTGTYFPLEPGDRLHRLYGGGPGWGVPGRRSREALLRDLADELVSEHCAVEVYELEREQLESARAGRVGVAT